MNVDRDKAWALLNEYTESESLVRHMLAVEAAMKAYANTLGEDENLWGVTGLLHDFDYEKWPNPDRDETGHPFTGVAILREQGYPEEMLNAILGHADYSGVARETPMAKALFAVDELCGFVMAVAYVRPENLTGMTPKSVKKKLKDKAFAAAVSRDDIRIGVEEMGVDQDAHIQTVIDAMQGISGELGFG
ncbi:MAG: HDIG domain-containing protein [Phycisphaerae bacterium]|nr:MAG: HDIG domain-containing protein [Phycisphaerae bacterium]